MSPKLRDRLQSPIAIVGVGCRFPEAKDANAFWSLLESGQVTFREIPKERWNHQTFYSSNQRDIDKAWVASGSFIEEFQEFAALHYGIAPRRLEVMDPQQRLLIESTRWAIQDAGYERRGFDRKRTGVFFGVSVSEFKNIAQSRVHAMQLAGGDFGAPAGSEALRRAVLEMAGRVTPMRAFHLSGSLTALAAASVAQTFDLGGPAYIIDSACASASVAVHDAMLNLRAGILDYAVAGGVYLNLSPDNLVAFTKIGAISPDGVCRPFDHRSNGFVQSDGVGVLMLRRLDDAIRDGDRIHAVLVGSGCNNDGRGEGPMTPRFEGQVDVLKQAYDDAGISPNSVAYFEAHGTATSIGDPVEVRALGEFLGQQNRESPAWIGSVKGNIGHAMSAAGIAGLVKAIKIIENQTAPPQPGFERLHPKLEMEKYPLQVPTQKQVLEPVSGTPLRVAVSSFGFGGTNSHLILEAPPASPRTPQVESAIEIGLNSKSAYSDVEPEAVIVTADSLTLLKDYLEVLAKYLSEGDGRKASLADLAFTLNARRTHERYRAVIGAQSPAELIRNLHMAAGAIDTSTRLPFQVSPHVSLFDGGPIDERKTPKIAFLFPGQGAQHTNILSGIRNRFPAFNRSLANFEKKLADILKKPISEYLYPENSSEEAEAELTQTEICQPAMAASALALGSLLNDVGVHAHTSLGHSLGEFTALSNSGVISPADAVRLVAQRGLAMRDLNLEDNGSMAAVMADKETTQSVIDDVPGVVVANINHPRQVSISGTTEAVSVASQRLTESGYEVRQLSVSHAFHSPLMEGVRTRVSELLVDAEFQAPRNIVASCIAGEVHTGDLQRIKEVLSRHATSSVDFVRGLHQTAEAGADLYIQVGAGSTLLSFVRATLGKEVRTLALAPIEDDRGYTFIRSLCTLTALGVDVDFDNLYSSDSRRVISLPETPVERQRYWVIKGKSQPVAEITSPLPGGGEPAVNMDGLDASSPPSPLASTETNTGQYPSESLVALFEKQAELLKAHAEVLAAQNQMLLRGDAPTAKLEQAQSLINSQLVTTPASNQNPLPDAETKAPEAPLSVTKKPAAPLSTADESPPSKPTVDTAQVKSQVFEIISKVSAFPKDALRSEQRLVGELGFDSLMVADLGGAIEAEFPDSGGIPPTLFSLETTVGDIAKHLTQSLDQEPAQTAVAAVQRHQNAASRYQVIPAPTPRPIPKKLRDLSEQTWLITEDNSKLSSEIGALLFKQNARLIRVQFTKDGVAAPATLTFGNINLWPESFAEGLPIALKESGIELTGFVHTAGLSATAVSGDAVYPISTLHPLAAALEVEHLGVITSLGGNLGLARNPSLSRNVLQAALLGYTKALRRERPDRNIRVLDINPQHEAKQNAHWIVEELLSSDTSAEVGFDGEQRLVPYLSPIKSSAPKRKIGNQDVVLITGGAGEIGTLVTRWAVSHQPKGVIIAGRRSADESINQLLSELSTPGCTVAYVSVDVTEPEALQGATRLVVDRVGQVTVAVHAAGVIEDAPASKKTMDSIHRVMSTKIKGAQAILQAFPDLQDLILFSSWAGRFGNANQTDYSAANELLDRLAVTSMGATRTVSIAWPPWTNTKMVASIPSLIRQTMEEQGVTFLDADEGIKIFDDIFSQQTNGIELIGRDLPAREWSIRTSEDYSLSQHPYLKDHRLNGRAVVPMASIVDWVASSVEAHKTISGAMVLEELQLTRGVMGDETATLVIQGKTSMDGLSSGDFQIYSGSEQTLAYRGKIRSLQPGEFPETVELSGSPRTAPLTLAEFYKEHTFHGPKLQGIKKLNRSTDTGISGIVRAAELKQWMPKSSRQQWTADPLILDGSFQLAGYWLHTHHSRAGFPIGFDRMILLRPFGREVYCVVRLEQVDDRGFSGHLWYSDAEGKPYAVIKGIRGQFAQLAASGDASSPAQPSQSVGTNGQHHHQIETPATQNRVASPTSLNATRNGTHSVQSPPIEVPEETWNIAEFPEVKALSQRFEMASLMGLHNPYFSVHAGTARDTSVVEGQELIHFSGYNYLGFSGRPEVVEAAQAAAAKYGTSVSASRVASGERPIHREFEQGVAEHVGVEDAILYVGGHATNVTTVGHIVEKDDLVIHDSLIHDSIFQGIKLSGAARRPFPHNDIAALEKVLSQVRANFRRVLICAEGIYSMDGDICDLPGLIELKKKYRCLLLIDEAHSIGVLGHQGRGVGHHFSGVNPKDVDMWMGTLSKSFASVGGYIAGSKALIEYLKYTAPGFVYSVGLAPPNTAAALASLHLMQKEPEVVERVRENSKFFLNACRSLGLDTGLAAGAAVVPVIVGDSMHCVRLSAMLKERGINVQPIVYPAVEDESSRLRFFISALHTREQLTYAAKTTHEALNELRSPETSGQPRI